MPRPSRWTSVFVLFGAVCLVHGQSTQTANAVKGPQPYTVEIEDTTVQTLANGTTITRSYKEIDARDGAGRWVKLTTGDNLGGDGLPWSNGMVLDHVANMTITWSSRLKVVRTIQEPTGDQRHGCWATDYGNYSSFGPPAGQAVSRPKRQPNPEASGPRRDRPKVEDLGTTKIMGVSARGQRITTTYPVGSIGNDQTIVAVNEFWSAPSLGLILRSVSDDPRMGKHTREVVNLTLDEPDPALFQAPDGYDARIETEHPVPCRE